MSILGGDKIVPTSLGEQYKYEAISKNTPRSMLNLKDRDIDVSSIYTMDNIMGNNIMPTMQQYNNRIEDTITQQPEKKGSTKHTTKYLLREEKSGVETEMNIY